MVNRGAWLSRRCVLSLLPMPACSQDTPRGSHTSCCAMASIIEMYDRGGDNSEKVLNRLLPHSQHQVSLQTIAKRKQVPTNTSMFRKLPPVCYFVTVFRWTGHIQTGQATVQYELQILVIILPCPLATSGLDPDHAHCHYRST